MCVVCGVCWFGNVGFVRCVGGLSSERFWWLWFLMYLWLKRFERVFKVFGLCCWGCLGLVRVFR